MEGLEKRVFRVLMNPRTYFLPVSGATPREVANILGISEEEVQKALDQLVEKGRAEGKNGRYSRKIKVRC